MSSRSFRLTPHAEPDVIALLQYGLEHWGAEQRDALAARLVSAFETLALFPETGRHREDLGSDTRRFLIKPHAIYDRLDEEGVLSLRLAHQRMDIRGRLEE